MAHTVVQIAETARAKYSTRSVIGVRRRRNHITGCQPGDLRDKYDNGKVTNVTGGVSGDKCEHMLTGERQL